MNFIISQLDDSFARCGAKKSVVVTWMACMLAVTVNMAVCHAVEEAEKKITFDEHIKPIFREHCAACHAEGDKASDLALDSYSGTLAGGSSGEVIAEGNSSGSRLYALMSHAEQPYMPPDQDAIAKEQLDLVKTWIEQGMPENSGSKIKRSNNAAASMLSNVSIGKPDGPPPMPEALLMQPVVTTDRSAAIAAIAASPWAPLVAVGGQQQVTLYHSKTGEMLGIIPFPEGEPQSLTFTRDGKQLLIGGGRHSHSGCAILVDIATGERIAKVGDELDCVLAADISPDKSRIAIAGPTKVIRVFDTASGEMLLELKKHTDWIFALRYSPDGILLASGDRSNGLVVWEAETGQLYSDLPGHKAAIRGLDFRADSNVLASASLDGTVKLWDLIENKEIKSWAAHGGGATSVAFSHNGLLATSGRDTKVKLWNGNGEVQKEFGGLKEAALEVAITGDAEFVAGGDWNGEVRVWNSNEPEQVRLISANPPAIDTRLVAAEARLVETETELTAAVAAAESATAAQASVGEQLVASEKQSSDLGSRLNASRQQEQTIGAEIGELDAKIKSLEQQLADARSVRETKAKELASVVQEATELATNAPAAEAAAKKMKEQHELLTQTMTEAVAQRDATQKARDLARAEVEKIRADQAAIEKKKAELEAMQEAAEAETQRIQAELVKAAQEAEQEKHRSEASAAELSQLKSQLDELQVAFEAASKKQSQLGEQLQQKLDAASKLQEQLEAVQQALLEAKEKHQLFEQSYRKPL